jgi:hypothetical protein
METQRSRAVIQVAMHKECCRLHYLFVLEPDERQQTDDALRERFRAHSLVVRSP